MRVFRLLVFAVIQLSLLGPCSLVLGRTGGNLQAGTVALSAEAFASSHQVNFPAAGARDGDRFGLGDGQAWKGRRGERNWYYQLRFDEPHEVGAILQVLGDDSLVLSNAPRRYVWQASMDGRSWADLSETATETESRLFRLHRLARPRSMQYLRIAINAVIGDFPTLREVEVYSAPSEKIAFPEW